MRQIATSSQVTSEQSIQFQRLLTLLETAPQAVNTHTKQTLSILTHGGDKQEVEKGLAYALVNVRDMNMICQEYGNVYTLIEGEMRRRKINRARGRQGALEIRTVARDEWKTSPPPNPRLEDVVNDAVSMITDPYIIATVPDMSKKDNLLSLPECSPS